MIKVMVTGFAGEGKSTVATLIKEALERNGIDVEFSDMNGTGYAEEIIDDGRLSLTLAAMEKRHAVVKVETCQLPRKAYRGKSR